MKKRPTYHETRTFKDMHLRSQEIFFGPDLIWILGPNAEFTNCKLVCMMKSSQFIVSTSTLIACEVTASVKLAKINWSPAKLMQCKFIGNFSDCDFGPRLDIGDKQAQGSVVNCDYSSSILDSCRFFNTNLQEVKFPVWPCFTIIDYQAAASDFQHCSISNVASRYARTVLGAVEEGEVALSMNGILEAKLLKCELEDLKEFLLGKPYVVM